MTVTSPDIKKFDLPCSKAAIIGARGGSVRIPGKNTKKIGGHPLIAHAVQASIDSGVFDTVVVSSDDYEIRRISLDYGADLVIDRDPAIATSTSPDILFIQDVLRRLPSLPDVFALVRPTSPFRTGDTIRKAVEEFMSDRKADSLRSVVPARQHPGKMFRINDGYLSSIMPWETQQGVPWHSSQYASLPEIWEQTGTLDVAWSHLPLTQGTLSGRNILAFKISGYEGFDIDWPEEWDYAEWVASTGRAELPLKNMVLEEAAPD